MNKIPPPPQGVAVLGDGGRLSLPWNLWLTAFIKTLQDVGDGLDALGLTGGGSGGVATGGAGPAVDLVLGPNDEGTANLPARANHHHQRSLGAEQDYVEAASVVQGLNIITPGLDSIVEPDLTTDIQALFYGFWPLTEAAGTTRKKTYGTVSTSDLVETGGTVAVAAGKYGNAVSCTSVTASRLGADHNLSPTQDISAGMTITSWIYPSATTPGPYQLLSYSNAGNFGLFVDRYANNIYPRVQYGSLPANTTSAINVDVGPDQWHFLAFWYDPADRKMHSQIDCGAVVESAAITALQEASVTGLDSLWVTGNWRGGYGNWPGRVGSLGIFPSVLTQAQRERVMASRVSVGINWPALELFGAA